jgi:hypothetical protein
MIVSRGDEAVSTGSRTNDITIIASGLQQAVRSPGVYPVFYMAYTRHAQHTGLARQ